MRALRIYVASSQRNQLQPSVVRALRKDGHIVYDYKEPTAGESGFAFSAIDPNWQSWSPDEFRKGLKHPLAEQGFKRDMAGMNTADAFVLVQPCGTSAHLEAGWASGRGVPLAILLDGNSEPELMYKLGDRIFDTIDEVREWLSDLTR